MGILKNIGRWLIGKPVNREVTSGNPVTTAVANTPNVKLKKPRKKAVKKSAAVEVVDNTNATKLEDFVYPRREATKGTLVTKLPKGKDPKNLPPLKKAKNAKALVEGNAKLLYTDEDWKKNFLTEKITVVGAGGTGAKPKAKKTNKKGK